MPLVSVIVPNYNHARFLRQRLDSIFAQTFQDFEVILLDDCSTDESKEVLAHYATHEKVSHFIVNEKNSGSTFKQWKKGLDLAKGTYIWIAESDDWADECFLEVLVAGISQEEGVALAYCRSYRASKNGENLGIHKWGEAINPERWTNDFVNEGSDELKNYLIHRNTIPNTSAVLFNKYEGLNAIQKVTNFRYCGDWLFWIYIVNQNKLFYTSKVLNFFRRYDSATSFSTKGKAIRDIFIEYSIIPKKVAHLFPSERSCTLQNHWIVDLWYGKKKYIKKYEYYLFPPLTYKLRLLFYKKIIKEFINNTQKRVSVLYHRYA